MRVFLHQPSGFRVGLSLKVLFSFHARHKEFMESMSDSPPDFFICRNPFSRAQSLFHDKCRARATAEGQPQVCQQVLMDHFGMKQKTELAQLSFGGFCAAIHYVVLKEQHFHSQVTGYVAPSRELIRMEYDLPKLGDILGVDYSIKENATEHGHWTDEIGQHGLHTIRVEYQDDFKTFNY